MEVQFARGLPVAEVVDPAAQNSIELIETVPDRAVLREKAQVPLADQSGFVARLLEQRGRGRMLRRQSHTLVAGTERLSQANRKAGRVSPRHEGHSGRSTDCSGGGVSGERQSF